MVKAADAQVKEMNERLKEKRTSFDGKIIEILKFFWKITDKEIGGPDR